MYKPGGKRKTLLECFSTSSIDDFLSLATPVRKARNALSKAHCPLTHTDAEAPSGRRKVEMDMRRQSYVDCSLSDTTLTGLSNCITRIREEEEAHGSRI